jgi:hypothetical protein
MKDLVKEIIDNDLINELVTKNTQTKFKDAHYLFGLSLTLEIEQSSI